MRSTRPLKPPQLEKISHHDPEGRTLLVVLKRSDHKQAVELELKNLLKNKDVMPIRTKLEMTTTINRPLDCLHLWVKKQLQEQNAWPLPKEKALVLREPIGFESPGYSLGDNEGGTFLKASIEQTEEDTSVPHERMHLQMKKKFWVAGYDFEGGDLQHALEEHLSQKAYPWRHKITLVEPAVPLPQAPTRAEFRKSNKGGGKGKSHDSGKGPGKGLG